MCLINFLLLVFILTFVKCHVILDLSSSNWRVHNENLTIATNGPVPGGIYSLLEDDARIGDILFGKNDINYRWVGKEEWTYTRKFELNSTHLEYPSIQIVLHGVDTLSEVSINNQYNLSTDNMFVRYNAEIKTYLVEGENEIVIRFKSPINAANELASKLKYTVPPVCHPPTYHGECNVNMLRKMQASYAWDWGPAFPSIGVWQPVEVVLSQGPVIRSVAVSTTSEGSSWRLTVSVWFDPSDMKLKDTLFVELSNHSSGLILLSGQKFNMMGKTGEDGVNLTVLVNKAKVNLWWPNGYGEQNLYNLRVYSTHSEKRIQIGFRTIELIQENVSQDETLDQGTPGIITRNKAKLIAEMHTQEQAPPPDSEITILGPLGDRESTRRDLASDFGSDEDGQDGRSVDFLEVTDTSADTHLQGTLNKLSLQISNISQHQVRGESESDGGPIKKLVRANITDQGETELTGLTEGAEGEISKNNFSENSEIFYANNLNLENQENPISLQWKTFYFLVNGVKIFAKGSNWIPSHVLPERLSDSTRVVPLLEAAASANFNMLRVWGGGVYESNLFYETCDRLGILVWQDLMFACSMYPVGEEYLESVKVEIRQQIQRLQHHPSIAIWAGNNENEAALSQNWYGTAKNFTGYKSDYLKLYVETIMPIVISTDKSRKYITSSPSNGVKTKDEEYVSTNPSDTLYGDVHYYNYMSDGWDYRIYPNPRFASEYGVQSLPTPTCLRSALPLGEMKWDSGFVTHRQHAPAGNTIIESQIMTNLPSSKDIQDIIYLSQINQAMSMKVESEKYRRLKSILLDSGEGYTMGALYWQLNDIWQAPSWASIDYCGHWKMLHYFAKNFFSPVIVSPELSGDGTKVSVYVVIDGKAKHHNANVTLSVYKWSSGLLKPVREFNSPTTLVDNESFVALKLPLSRALRGGKKEEYFITTTLKVNDDLIAPENFLFFTSLVDKYPETLVKISDSKLVSNNTAELTLTTENYALFVWLELNGLEGTFSGNGFHMFQPSTNVTFKSKYPLDETSLKKITVTWLKRAYS